VLVFDLAVVAKALAQFEHSSEVLVFDLGASPKATVQFEQAMEAVELMLEHCLCLHLDKCLVALGHAGVATLPLNMVDAKAYQSLSLVAGML
jgi:DNA primase